MSPRRAKAVAGRVGEDPAAALRDHLVDAAARLMAEGPIGRITTRAIARAAGVSDGVLYNYFGDKNDLLVEALLRQLRAVFEPAEAFVPAPGTGDVAGNLEAFAMTLLELERKVVPLIAGLVADPLLFHRLFAALHTDPFGPRWFREPVTAYLDGERQLGRIRADADPAAVTLLLAGSTSLLALTGHLGQGAQGAEPDRVRGVVDELLRGLRPA
jgi:AcrR family transcriptional regulator